uniref:Putative secreted protein n=1 Tax=Anopheles darlingi TaxID=43151 RepID=A0A2M4DKM5_ANODA
MLLLLVMVLFGKLHFFSFGYYSNSMPRVGPNPPKQQPIGGVLFCCNGSGRTNGKQKKVEANGVIGYITRFRLAHSPPFLFPLARDLCSPPAKVASNMT